MNVLEATRSSLESLAGHKLRSALTMLGMIFGVGAVISMLSIGAGAERQSLEMIERMGLHNVLVRDKDLKRDIALKVLRPEYADHEDVVQRFVEEAQVGGQLQHPGIVPVYGIGMQEDGRPSFAMKLIKGQTLAELLSLAQ